MALASANSTTTVIPQAIKNRYYDELFLRVAEANLVYQQLGQINRQVPKGENGAAIFWTRWVNLALVTAGQGEGVPTTAQVMSAINVSGVASQYDAAVAISDLMAQYSLGDIMKAAVQRLAYNAGLSIDTIVRNAIVPNATQQVATSATLCWSSVPATGVLTVGELRKGRRTLQKNNAFTVGGNTNTNDLANAGYFVAVISPDVAYDVTGDTATGSWVDANRYAGSDEIFSGEIGKLYGIRFIQTSNAYTFGTGLPTSGTVHGTLLAGSDLFGVSTLQNLQTYIKDFGSGGVGDPTNKIATAGWKCTFAAQILNSAYGVTIASAVSA